ncbi:LysR substrate-binding domain-containing protein [Phenylobacterium aquaticum]|uniref:LysR substrate-binding domain-containing protein n=1 Tax=Phenylobacterium aquaticum TaxID=1763816 RepID=UPI0026EF1B51|nr:LysR substrate-binding domain-containing protein [Phenylobacterium aquaticum]
MVRRLPPLSALRAFEAAARLGSVTRAAEELGRTHGAVSRHVRSLQDHLGAPLFDKAGTGLRLTSRGEALLATVAEALDGLERGWTRLADDAQGPSLHVACSATFAVRWLAPRLAGFYRAHPKVKVRLSMTSAGEMRRQGADLVIAWDRDGFPRPDQARAMPLAEAAFGPVCAPDYPWSDPEGGVLRLPCRIGHDFTTSAWDQWGRLAGIGVAWTEERSFPHTHLCLEAALAGVGVALVERRMAQDDLAVGRLSAPLGFQSFPQGLAAIPAGAGPLTPQAADFVSWLQAELAAAP